MTPQPPYANADAFSALYEQTHVIVYRYVFGLRGGPVQEVEDLTAETYWKAWRSRTSFSGPPKAALAWLLKIAQRLVIDSFRKQTITPEMVQIDDLNLSDGRLGPEGQTERLQQIQVLAGLLYDLPLDKREMLTLRYILGWRVKDIAAYLDVPQNTVSVAIRRTLQRLQAEWPQPELDRFK